MAKNLMSVFGKQGDEPEASTPLPGSDVSTAAGGATEVAARSVMILGKTLFFKGELSADEDLMLFGRVEGSINHSQSVTVGVGGVVTGNLRARNVTVKGTVEGDIISTELVVISPTGNVHGDIIAPRVGIVEGARFNGAVKMPPAISVAESKAAEALPAATPAMEPLSEPAVQQLLIKS